MLKYTLLALVGFSLLCQASEPQEFVVNLRLQHNGDTVSSPILVAKENEKSSFNVVSYKAGDIPKLKNATGIFFDVTPTITKTGTVRWDVLYTEKKSDMKPQPSVDTKTIKTTLVQSKPSQSFVIPNAGETLTFTSTSLPKK